ncbi:hypothetical protein [Evansella clarkii]|nr:hypothetical protein [Evansella clarkii]
MVSENMKKDIQERAMGIIESLKGNEELANFVEELEEGNEF